jgi:hypothetical protein
MEAQVHLNEAGIETTIEEAAADKGYHAAAQLELAESLALRTYIPEPARNVTVHTLDSSEGAG